MRVPFTSASGARPYTRRRSLPTAIRYKLTPLGQRVLDLESERRRELVRVLQKATYTVSDDGLTLTVMTEGLGLKGPFKTVAVFERVVPDPYVPQR